MGARPAGGRAAGEPGVAHQAAERQVKVVVAQPGPGQRDEEGRRAGLGAELVPALCVGPERRDGAVVQRKFAGLAEFGVTHDQDPVGEVDVVAVQSQRLTDAHPGHPQQPDQRREGRLAQR